MSERSSYRAGWEGKGEKDSKTNRETERRRNSENLRVRMCEGAMEQSDGVF